VDRASAVGFWVENAGVLLALVRPASPLGEESYMGLEVTLGGAGIDGVDGMTLGITGGKVLVNRATAANGDEIDLASGRINWAQATLDANDPDQRIPAFDARLTHTVSILVEAQVAIDLFGFVVGTGSFSMTRETVDVDQNSNGVFSSTERDLQDATLLLITITGLDAFVGVGARLEGSTVVTTGATGFSVTGGTIGIALIKANPDTIPGDNRSYLATTSSLREATFAGLPAGIDIKAADIAVEINRASGTVPLSAPAQAPAALNWNSAVGEANGTAFTPRAVNVAGRAITLAGEFTGVSGALRLNAFDVLRTYAAFEMVLRTVDVDLNPGAATPTIDLQDAQLLTIALDFLRLDPAADLTRSDLDADGDSDAADDLALYNLLLPAGASGPQPGFFIGVPGAVGVSVDSGRLAFATLKANADPAKKPAGFDRTYTALLAGVRGATLAGLPDLIDVDVVRLDYATNSSSGTHAMSPNALDWTRAIDLQADDAAFNADAIVVGGRALTLTEAVDSISGALTLDIGGFVFAAGEFELVQKLNQSIDDGTLGPVGALSGATLQTLHLDQVFLFVGANGGFLRDADGNVTGLDTSDAVGFSVSGRSAPLLGRGVKRDRWTKLNTWPMRTEACANLAARLLIPLPRREELGEGFRCIPHS
jgi:hypothetical protein